MQKTHTFVEFTSKQTEGKKPQTLGQPGLNLSSNTETSIDFGALCTKLWKKVYCSTVALTENNFSDA